MKDNYIILDFGKVFIVYENNERKFYKETEYGLANLSEKEIEVLNNIFDSSKYNEYYSERLVSILSRNGNIENKDYIINFLNFLESIIPEHCRTNFYRNLETLKVKLNFDIDFSSIENTNNSNDTYEQVGGYNTRTNFLYLVPSSLKKNWEIAQTTYNPIEFYWNYVALDVLHELSHMASSKYNPETGISLCGFDKYPKQNQSDSNRGITEGMTEVIAMSGVPNTIEIASGYYIEASFVNQLMLIVGTDTMLESYFDNRGTIEMERELNKYGNENLNSQLLFRRIEDNFYLRNFDGKQGILASIQSDLVEYFKNKMLFCIKNNLMSPEDVLSSLARFEVMLLTPQKMLLMQKNPENYIGLEESLRSFYLAKEAINNELVGANISKKGHNK